MRQIEFICATCSFVFISKKGCKNNTPRFCSMKCFGVSRRKDRQCVECGGFLKCCNKKFCSRECSAKNQTGRLLSEAHRLSLSLVKKGKRPQHFMDRSDEFAKKRSKEMLGKPQPWMRGKNHPNYVDGGKGARERTKDMGRTEYKTWRRSVFERDDYTCQLCNVRGSKMCADHIKSYSSYPELRYDINNGRTLCVQCHYKTDNYGRRAVKREVKG